MSVEILKNKNGTVYKAVFCKNRKRMSKCFDRKTDAVDWLNQQKAVQKFGYQAKLKFSVAAQRWLQNHSLLRKSPAGQLMDKRMIEGSFAPFFGSLDLEAIVPDHVESYISNLKSKGLKNATVNRYLTTLRAILNHYVKKRYLFFNAVSIVGLLPEDEVKFDCLNFEEANQFLAFAQDKYQRKKRWVYRLYLLAINTGLRWGEIAALQWDKVDFAQQQITVSRTYCYQSNQIRETTKGRKIRFVGINSSLLPELEDQYREAQSNQGLVFPQSPDKVLDLYNFKRDHFDKDMKEAGIRKIRFHDLRHTFASHFMMRNGPLYDLQKLMGHSSIAVTERYAHLSPQSLVAKTELVAINGGNTVVNLERRFKHVS